MALSSNDWGDQCQMRLDSIEQQ